MYKDSVKLPSWFTTGDIWYQNSPSHWWRRGGQKGQKLRFFYENINWGPPVYNMLLLLSHFSRVWLCPTPWTAASQAPLFMEFARQEHWSGLHALLQVSSRWFLHHCGAESSLILNPFITAEVLVHGDAQWTFAKWVTWTTAEVFCSSMKCILWLFLLSLSLSPVCS